MFRISATILIALTLVGSLSQAAAPKTPFLVVIDPGHGGGDTGAIRKIDGKRVTEKDLTLQIAKNVASALRARGIPAILTRSDDSFIPLDRRAQIANRAGSVAEQAVFISIHLNTSPQTSSSGIETYIFNAATNEASARLAKAENGISRASRAFSNKNKGVLDLIFSDLASTSNFGGSVELACQVQRSVASLSNIKDRGVRQALFYVLMQTRMPAILFEPGFLSNPTELKQLITPHHQLKLAQGLAQGILSWKNQYKETSPNRLIASAVAKPSCQIH